MSILESHVASFLSLIIPVCLPLNCGEIRCQTVDPEWVCSGEACRLMHVSVRNARKSIRKPGAFPVGARPAPTAKSPSWENTNSLFFPRKVPAPLSVGSLTLPGKDNHSPPGRINRVAGFDALHAGQRPGKDRSLTDPMHRSGLPGRGNTWWSPPWRGRVSTSPWTSLIIGTPVSPEWMPWETRSPIPVPGISSCSGWASHPSLPPDTLPPGVRIRQGSHPFFISGVGGRRRPRAGIRRTRE